MSLGSAASILAMAIVLCFPLPKADEAADLLSSEIKSVYILPGIFLNRSLCFPRTVMCETGHDPETDIRSSVFEAADRSGRRVEQLFRRVTTPLSGFSIPCHTFQCHALAASGPNPVLQILRRPYQTDFQAKAVKILFYIHMELHIFLPPVLPCHSKVHQYHHAKGHAIITATHT